MKNENLQMIRLLQIAGGTFPTGGFSQSLGLETYITQERIYDTDSLEAFICVYLQSVVAEGEGPILLHAHKLARTWKEAELKDLSDLAIAMKLTKESREACMKTGKALMRVSCPYLEDAKLKTFYEKRLNGKIAHPTAFGIIAQNMQISAEAALAGYIFSLVNTLIQSALKLIPLGNTEAQALLYHLSNPMEQAIKQSKKTDLERLNSFCPGMDISSMHHETLETRLYMS